MPTRLVLTHDGYLKKGEKRNFVFHVDLYRSRKKGKNAVLHQIEL